MSLPANRYQDVPCHLHGGIGDALGCRYCLESEPLPPGESAEYELSGDAAGEAFHTALRAYTAPATKYLTVREIVPSRAGRYVLVAFSWNDLGTTHHVTVRMPTAKARSLAARLSKVVE